MSKGRVAAKMAFETQGIWKEMSRLHRGLCKASGMGFFRDKGLRVIVIFEGRGTPQEGGPISAITNGGGGGGVARVFVS